MRAGCQNQHAIDRGAVEERLDALEAGDLRDPIAVTERGQQPGREVAQRDDVEGVGEAGQERQMDGLGDRAEARHADPQPGPAGRPGG